MSRLQRFFKKIFPASWAEAMEKDSRAWMLRCRVCSHERSIWDLGGIRWKGTGKSFTRLTCPQCGKNTTHETYKRP